GGELEDRARIGAGRGGYAQHGYQPSQSRARCRKEPPELGHLASCSGNLAAPAARGRRPPLHVIRTSTSNGSGEFGAHSGSAGAAGTSPALKAGIVPPPGSPLAGPAA